MPVLTNRARRVLGVLVVLPTTVLGVGAACAEIGTGPDRPAAIELEPFPSPSVVLGDTLRNFEGVASPIRAIVRNVSGDAIADAPVRYLYADFNRDSALQVDSATGVVVAAKPTSGGEARLAARVGGTLQVLRPILVTIRPDTMEGTSPTQTLNVFPRDTAANVTAAFRVVLQNTETATKRPVNGWVVRYRLLSPANPSNDTTQAAWLVRDGNRPSTTDTTGIQGDADRQVRVRAGAFPAAGTVDSVVVEVQAFYRGQPIKGAPLRLRAIVADTVRR
ncbi:MAG: hypothetical protein IBJ19_12560 [Gemmatimonadaceae bacterium]|nr:hypothetical protein [Gemmatimonadaceae bacterium]